MESQSIEIPTWSPNSYRSSEDKNKAGESSRSIDESELQSVVIENDTISLHIDSFPSKGVFLTWKDLQVTVPDRQNDRRTILWGLTGYADPGHVLGILGPSGSGKSTLLNTLAGRLSSSAQQTGEILINGCKETLAFGTSVSMYRNSQFYMAKSFNRDVFTYWVKAYVTQDDALMTTLSIREALYYSAQLQLPDTMSKIEKRERVEMTIREMGLQDSMNTRIGRISGGQKRRVSICIEILTRPKLLFLDEPTSGLDGAAAYHVMNHIVKLAQQHEITVISSIHQPSSEVFLLFHNLCLLSAGFTIYFGPISMIEQFFSSNGFPCPNQRNPSDHYLRTINKDFDLVTEHNLSSTTILNTKEAIEVLVKSYKSSRIWKQVQKLVDDLSEKKNEEAMEKKGSQTSFMTQCIVLTQRSFVNMYRDIGYYWLRLAIYIGISLCMGTMFLNIGFSYGSIQARGTVLMFIAAFLTFMTIGGFPSFIEDMKIFQRERLNGHYKVGAFVIGNSISSIPYLLIVSLIPGAVIYFLVGLRKGFEHFACFSSILFSCMLLVESMMMVVASVVPNFLMGIITGAGIIGVMVLNGGFFRLPNDLPKPFWKYPMYYISFHKYANQGFYKNEFDGLTFPNRNQVGTISGDEILKDVWQVEMGYSKWVDVGILLGMVVIYRLVFLGIITIVEKAKPVIVRRYYGCWSFSNEKMSPNPSTSPKTKLQT